MERFSAWLDVYFCVSERGSTVGTEIRGGCTTFLTMSYILMVNPIILATSGIPLTDAICGTSMGAGVGCLISGILGNLPFGLAPGLGLSAYLSYGLVETHELSWQGALTSCAISGLLVGLATGSKFTDLVMYLTPLYLKLAIVVGMGLLLAFIGMKEVNIVEADPEAIVRLGDLDDWTVYLAMGGAILVATLIYHKIKGAILITILTLTTIYWLATGLYPHGVLAAPRLGEGFNAVALHDVSAKYLFSIASFTLIAILDVSGVIFGLGQQAGLVEDGAIPNGKWVFYGCAAGTIVAAYFGSTPIIVQVESGAGIKEGGRTGLTAVVIGLLFLSSLVLTPLFESIPSVATAPILVLVGCEMMKVAKEIDWNPIEQALPAFVTIAVMPFTCSIPNGIAFGIAAALCLHVSTGKAFGYAPREDASPEEVLPINGKAPAQ